MTIVAALASEDPPLEVAESRMELDSHANMPVVGHNAYVLSDTGRRTFVGAYHPELETKQLKIVDAAVLYQDAYTGVEYILVVRNALHVPSMGHNLIPPFILREHGSRCTTLPRSIVTTLPRKTTCSGSTPSFGYRYLCMESFPTSQPDYQLSMSCNVRKISTL